jgi:hypothetical protein
MNWKDGYCILCKNEAGRLQQEKMLVFDCKSCGRFIITDWCRHYLKKSDKKLDLRRILSVYVKKNQGTRRFVEITRRNFKKNISEVLESESKED